MLWMIRGCQKKGAYRDDMGEMQGGPEAQSKMRMRCPWTNTDPKVGGGKTGKRCSRIGEQEENRKDPSVLYDGV